MHPRLDPAVRGVHIGKRLARLTGPLAFLSISSSCSMYSIRCAAVGESELRQHGIRMPNTLRGRSHMQRRWAWDHLVDVYGHAAGMTVLWVLLLQGAIDIVSLRRVVKSLGLDIPDDELQVSLSRTQECSVGSPSAAVPRSSCARHTLLMPSPPICPENKQLLFKCMKSCISMSHQDMINEFGKDGLITEQDWMAIMSQD